MIIINWNYKTTVDCILERICLGFNGKGKRNHVVTHQGRYPHIHSTIKSDLAKSYFPGSFKHKRLHMGKIDLEMFITPLLRLTIAQGMDDKLHERATRRARKRAGTGTDRGRG